MTSRATAMLMMVAFVASLAVRAWYIRDPRGAGTIPVPPSLAHWSSGPAALSTDDRLTGNVWSTSCHRFIGFAAVPARFASVDPAFAAREGAGRTLVIYGGRVMPNVATAEVITALYAARRLPLALGLGEPAFAWEFFVRFQISPECDRTVSFDLAVALRSPGSTGVAR